MRNCSYLPSPTFLPCSTSVSHPRLFHLLPLSGAERWGVEAVVSPIQPLCADSASPHCPSAPAWAIPLGCGDPRTAPARILCRDAVLQTQAAPVWVPHRLCSPCQEPCSRLLLPCRLQGIICFAVSFSSGCRGIQWIAHSTSSFFSFSSSSSHLAAHRAFPHTSLLDARQCFSLSYTCDSSTVPCGRAFGASWIWHLAALASPCRGPCSPLHTAQEQHHVPNAVSRR